MIVYIAHPLRPNPASSSETPYEDCLRNIRDTANICGHLLKTRPDLLILSPIHAFGFVNPLCEGEKAELVLTQCRRLLALADELWVYGDHEKSEGCRMEIAHARSLGIPIVYKKEEEMKEGGNSDEEQRADLHSGLCRAGRGTFEDEKRERHGDIPRRGVEFP
jgi:hypothetical protein